MNQKKFVFTLSLIAILIGTFALGFTTYVLANPSPSTSGYSEGGPHPGAPSYTVWKEDSTYYAKNKYGTIDYEGSNASQIINNAIDNSVGIVLLEGNTEYSLTGKIRVDDNTILRGEGFSTIIKQANSQAMGWLIDNKNHVPGSTNQEAMYNVNVIIENLAVDGNYQNQGYTGAGSDFNGAGILLYVKNLIIRNVKTINTGRYGGLALYSRNVTIDSVFISKTFGSAAYASGIFLSNRTASVKTTIENSHLEDITGKAIYLEDAPENVIIQGNTIKNATEGISTDGADVIQIRDNIIDGAGVGSYGVNLAGGTGSQNITIQGTTIKNWKESGIKVYLTHSVSIDANHIFHNGYGSVLNEYFAIFIVQGANHTSITNNKIFNNYAGGIEYRAGNKTYGLIMGNDVYDNNYNLGVAIGVVASTYIRIIGNLATGSDYGIVTNGVSDYNIITSNIARANKSGNLSYGGSNNQVANNIAS